MKLMRRIGPFYDQFDEVLYHTLLNRFRLPLGKPFGEFSAGMKVKLSIIFALSHHPKLMILDEPTANLDPVSRREVLDLLYEFMQQEDHSLLFSTHNTACLLYTSKNRQTRMKHQFKVLCLSQPNRRVKV